jgi:hypothetical protein
MLPIQEWFNQYSSQGFAVEPLSQATTMIDGRVTVIIETSEIGSRVHYYVPRGADVIEIAYGLFADQFVNQYQLMLQSIELF